MMVLVWSDGAMVLVWCEGISMVIWPYFHLRGLVEVEVVEEMLTEVE